MINQALINDNETENAAANTYLNTLVAFIASMPVFILIAASYLQPFHDSNSEHLDASPLNALLSVLLATAAIVVSLKAISWTGNVMHGTTQRSWTI